jgi:uncharacterized protein YciI
VRAIYLVGTASSSNGTKGSSFSPDPTLGPINTGVTVFEAPDEQAAQRIVDEDPAVAGGFAR